MSMFICRKIELPIITLFPPKSGNKRFKSATFPYITFTLIDDHNDKTEWDSCQLLAPSLGSVSQHRFNKQFKTYWSLKASTEAKSWVY